MSTDLKQKPTVKVEEKVARPKRHKVIVLNDDYTPQEFVVIVLRSVFRITGERSRQIMLTAHMKGSCVVMVYPHDVAETKANEANDLARDAGHPLTFTTEPEE